MTVCVVADGQRLELTVAPTLTVRDLKQQVIAAAGGGLPSDGAWALLDRAIHRGKKLHDDSTLEGAGVHHRDKLMVSTLPHAKEAMRQLSTCRARREALADRAGRGEAVHEEELTREMLTLDSIDLGGVPDPAQGVLRELRKQELRALELMGSGQA
eukprot:CAMPEP_0206008654 /NCGR_PEP_ID=MMETSP1464-20131121/8020_1 /ASSEMBLY_ACC=CAM_ASM_001124 /TAXON_ID=119497 /ORGANISM="Exanthemachrysis gayraliae, Strain RCC1523" /LENGTH=155 /DNA_ID=CAMNT_0053382203 /DNA_START=1 /DNA_END=468 /DNA_ORIENTATION=+